MSRQETYTKKIVGVITVDDLVKLRISLDNADVPQEGRVLYLDKEGVEYFNSLLVLDPVPAEDYWVTILGFRMCAGGDVPDEPC